ncbi:MAG: helix-turn-helix domain-containing protein [Sedimentitalea sp.]|uniref:GlxA family transcriptional regulator n=1 Tax=Sedimentitalea sp. TaxID=2048915 RepID=UPI003264561F
MLNVPNIAIADYPGVQKASFYGLVDLFALIPRLDPTITAPHVQIATPEALPTTLATAVIFPASLDGSRGDPAHPMTDWLRQQHAQGAIACSVCAGAFWLGHAGLLAGRPVTTHWALEQDFRARFPDTDVQAEHILIDDHDVITAGGLMAWVDLGLHLTGLWYGGEMVSQLARHLLVDPAGREQRNYSSFRPRRDHGDAAILIAQRYIDQQFQDILTVSDLAAQAGVPLRSFNRRFQKATRHSPAAYLQALRVEKARGALERGNKSVAQIAWAVGYRDIPAFGRAFRSVTGLTPGAYRARFRTGSPL